MYIDSTGRVKPLPQSPGPAVIGAIGASITFAGSVSYYNATTSGSIAFGYQSILGSALLRTGGKYTAGGIAATSGYTTAQMVSTHLPVVLTTNWNYCVVGEVTNDLLNSVPLATTKQNILIIVNSLLAKGITPILSTMPPQDSNKTGAGLTFITQFNEWVKQQARLYKIPIVDYHNALVDPASNGYVASPSYTTDGTHPNAQGCKVMTDALVDVLNSLPVVQRVPVQGSYNPNLMIPDVVTTSAGSDKMAGSGSTGGGWAYANVTHTSSTSGTRWKGNAATVKRGTAGDYLLGWPVTAGSMVAGHKLRLSFGIDIPDGAWVGSGTWSAFLWNLTQSQGIAGFSVMQWPANDGTSYVAEDASITSGVNTITCSTTKPFRPSMVGNAVQVVSGLTARFAANTRIIGVSQDGVTAYCSANASATASSQTMFVLGKPQLACFEFDVQSDMVGDSFSFLLATSTAGGVAASASQITLVDLTALGVV